MINLGLLSRGIFGKFNTISIASFARQVNVSVKNKLIDDPPKTQQKVQTDSDDDVMASSDQFKGFQEFDELSNLNQGEQMDQNSLKTIQDTLLFKGDDPYYDKLVERPQKKMLWGLGGELMKTEFNVFDINKEISIDSIMAFLELNQIKDIEVTDISQYQENHLYRYGIVGSMYSSIHGWKVCKELCKSLNIHWNNEQQQRQKDFGEGYERLKKNRASYGLLNRDLKNKKILGMGIKPQIYGTRDDEWLMVGYKDFMIHLNTESSRSELELDKKWKYQQTAEDDLDMEKMVKAKRKGYFEPFN